ncbi:SpoIID/LytB domain-containing protein [Ruania alkalisoli]|uniref:SpoIID/LytB domain-containing protein n=1 Tax=Ruania alkalisoli TaxID=2779775 RepID=A0A7M1SRL1_9MICO|nr:SpoIID/LytB domain-containing protein [Ruania alkalisoli]QOR69777.1 SpoIID/LytB domain-containing protein [Ruania alkalisoli]
MTDLPLPRRVRRGVAALLAAALLVIVTTVSTAPPAAAEATVTLDGRGYGHGIGMSQWGAQGRAAAGHTYTQILSAYYPGTTQGVLPDSGEIRVWIQRDQDNLATIVAEPGTSVRLDSASYALPSTLGGATVDRWRVGRSGSTLVVQGRAAGTWRDHGLPALTAALSGRTSTDLVTSDGTVRLEANGYQEYQGAIRAVLVGSALRTVVVTTYAGYLPSVVTAEMPAGWSVQALRAQAVAARTYARFDQASGSSWYDTCDTTSCQVFRGIAEYSEDGTLLRSFTHPRTRAAVTDTSGVVVLASGAPAFTQFSASNGGYSVQGSRPYLRAAADPYDGLGAWQTVLTGSQITAAYPAIGTFRSIQVTRDGLGPYGGRATSVTLTGTSDSVTVSGAQLRAKFSLRSTLFAATLDGVALESPQRDWDSNGMPDLLARGPDGTLYSYLARGPTAWHTRTTIGHGWQTMGAMTQVHDFSGTGHPEVIAIQPSTAQLLVYAGDGRGGWGTPRVMGRGWRNFDQFIGVQDWDGAGSVGLIVRQTSTGDLLYYGGNGRGGLSPGVRIGHGWRGMDQILAAGDWDGDGNPDLFARQASTGALYLYRGDGNGGFRDGARIGNGWQIMNSMLGASDWNHDGTVDLLAREVSGGRLWLYPSNGAGTFLPRVQVGNGWTGFDLVR